MPRPAARRDPASVKADYERRVEQWRHIYDGRTFHDHVIRDRLLRTLDELDRIEAREGRADRGAALDVGCGAGQLTEELALRGFDTAAIDVAEGMVAATRERLEAAGVEADVRVGDTTRLPWEDGRFRWVFALGVIEYLEDPAAGLRELHRVLAPGGRAVVTGPNAVRASFLLDPIRVVQGALGRRDHPYLRRYFTPWTLRRMLLDAGFDAVVVDGHGIGPLTVAGRPLLDDETSIRVSDRLEEALPPEVTEVLGNDLIAFARRP